ncbi:cobalamin-dependent protein [Salimicrobium sp. PL1-032A]|uniref:cobalamin B12-binding domain-containing protein n=1 Tax=Salimicrobium sp. PL1-032A TaxID=3095364 RepID=UPI00326193DC
MNHVEFSKKYLEYTMNGDKPSVFQLVKDELEKGTPVEAVYKGIEAAMYNIGEKWKDNEISIAHEHLATAITQWILMTSFPQLIHGHRQEKVKKKVVSFTVAGNNHDLGIKMVNDILENKGFAVTYLGTNLPINGALDFMKTSRPDYVLISVALPVNIPYAKEAAEAIRETSELEGVKIIIGGYCFKRFPSLLDKMSYDYYAADLDEFIELSDRL